MVPSTSISKPHMPHWFPVVPRPAPRETLPSFLSRLAAVKGVGAQEFACDLGASFKRVLSLDEEALSGLSR